MKSKGSFVALVIAFLMLWLPVGQHDFLLEHWMKVGTFMAPFLLLAAFVFAKDRDLRTDPSALSLFLLVAYIAHQFEEHWIDVFGQTYAFYAYLNAFLSDLTGSATGTEFMSQASIFVINTSLVWLVGAAGIWRGSDYVFAALCMAAMVVVNGASHIAASFIGGGYNPGLLSGVVLFFPLGSAVYVWLIRARIASVYLVIASIIWAVLAHIIMIAGILAMSRLGWLPELAYFMALVVWSLLPAFLFSQSSRLQTPDASSRQIS